MMMTKLLAAAAATLAVSLAACSSSNPYVAHRESLARAEASLGEGRLQGATSELEGLIGATSGDHRKFAVQRFYAAYLLSRAHLAGSMGRPWYRDPQASRSAGIGLGSGTSGEASETAHLVASMLYSSYGVDWAGGAASGNRVVDGEPLLPDSLAALEVERAKAGLELGQLAVYSRLGFDDRVSGILDSSPMLHALDGCEAVLDRAEAQAELRPWVYLTLHRYLATRDELAAFPFAMRAIDAGEGSLPGGVVPALSTWITRDAGYVWKCPECNAPLVPELGSCQIDQTSAYEFYAERRAGG